MKIGIIGPGALGCLFASRLFLAAQQDDDILLIHHHPDRAVAINEDGIRYESGLLQQTLPIPVVCNFAEEDHFDVLFSCVKSYHLETSLKQFASLLSPQTLLIFLQNGISHLKYATSSLPCIPVFGSCSEGATRIGPGHVRHAGKGETFLGFSTVQNQTAHERLEKLCTLLCLGGIQCRITSDILSRIWAKLFINVGINGLSAINNCRNGELLKSASFGKDMEQLVREAMEVARRSGITILEDPVAATLLVCNRTANNISSMLQDVRTQRPTEIEAINGAICRIGRHYDIATPYNDLLSNQVRALEKEYREH
jgi:2-dehydropantoate 2-reductase